MRLSLNWLANTHKRGTRESVPVRKNVIYAKTIVFCKRYLNTTCDSLKASCNSTYQHSPSFKGIKCKFAVGNKAFAGWRSCNGLN